MPIFEYECAKCGRSFDALVRKTDVHVDCEYCGSPSTNRKVSAPAFHLKGSGWYKTDFSGKHKTDKDEKLDYEPPTRMDDRDANNFRKNNKDKHDALIEDGKKNAKNFGAR